jgi:hypothetical protein
MKYAGKAATNNTQQENDSRGGAVSSCIQGVGWGKKRHGAGQHSGIEVALLGFRCLGWRWGTPVLVTCDPILFCVPSVSTGNFATPPVPGTFSQWGRVVNAPNNCARYAYVAL